VLVLRYWADLREEEIVEIVGVRPATVRPSPPGHSIS